jgi:hypothetical protein
MTNYLFRITLGESNRETCVKRSRSGVLKEKERVSLVPIDGKSKT